MLVGVAHLRVGGIQIILGSRSGGADIAKNLTIQRYDQFRVCTVCRNIAQNIAIGILTPCTDSQIRLGFVDDLLAVDQIGFDLDVVFAPVLVGDVNSKMISIAVVVLGLNLKGILAGLTFLQKQFQLSLRTQSYRSAAAGLVTGHRCNTDIFTLRADQGHGVVQYTAAELIVIDSLSGLASGILAEYLSGHSCAVFL